jgi:hypothetical protein
MTAEKATKLAVELGVVCSPSLEPLTTGAKRALNKILRELDSEERSHLVLLNAAGEWSYHLVDGTSRIWHLTRGGGFTWNMLSNQHAETILSRAGKIIEEATTCS